MIYNIDSGELIEQLEGHKVAVNALAISPDRKYLVSSGFDGNTIVWKKENWEIIHTIFRCREDFSKSAFSPDSKRLVIIADHTISLWSLESGEEEGITIKPKGLTSVTFSQDGKWLVVGAADKIIRLWPINR